MSPPRHVVSLVVGAVLALAGSIALGVLYGSETVDLARALDGSDPLSRTILGIRAPRVLLAAIAGGGLSIVGASYQALLRNPLAEPYILGVSGGAAFGATLVIALGLGAATALGATLVPVSAFLGGLGATVLVYAVARRSRSDGTGTTILLAGVMVNAIAAALVTFLKTMVSPSKATHLLRWLTGFVGLPSSLALGATAAYVALGALVLLRDAGRLNLLSLGDEPAMALGVDVRALERRVFIASSCVVGAVVSQTGLIGFVGLVVPHALRKLVGPDHRLLLPLSLLGGASLLVLFDLGARLAFRWLGTEPPVGAVTALVGGPAFLAILWRARSPQAL